MTRIYIYKKDNGTVWADLKKPESEILYVIKPDVNGKPLKSPIPQLQPRIDALVRRINTPAPVPPAPVQETKPKVSWWRKLIYGR